MSGPSLVARPLTSNSHDAWERLAAAHGCIFDTLRWTELFQPALIRVGIYDAGGTLRGGFSLWEERRFGLRIRRNPPYTPQTGPFYEFRATNPTARTDEQRVVVSVMAEYLSKAGAAVTSLGLSPGITDTLPFFWRGWKVVPQYTYRIDLTQGEDVILKAMSPEHRNIIRKAQKDGISVEIVSETRALRSLVLNSFGRQGKAFPCEAMDAILRNFSPGKNSFCIISSSQGLWIAGVYIVHDSRTAYCLMTGYDSDHAHPGAGALAMWHAILKAKELGLEVFDFEGSVVPNIERYFRGFGGRLTPYFSVNKAWLPIEMLLKFRYRGLF